MQKDFNDVKVQIDHMLIIWQHMSEEDKEKAMNHLRTRLCMHCGRIETQDESGKWTFCQCWNDE